MGKPIGNISRMNHAGGNIPFQNIGFQVADPAAAHRILKIPHVSAGAGELLDFLAVIVVSPASASPAGEINMLALNHHTEINAAIAIYPARGNPLIDINFLTFGPGQGADFINDGKSVIGTVLNLKDLTYPLLGRCTQQTQRTQSRGRCPRKRVWAAVACILRTIWSV